MIYYAINSFNVIIEQENIQFGIFAARFFVTATIGVLVAFGIRQVIRHDEKVYFTAK